MAKKPAPAAKSAARPAPKAASPAQRRAAAPPPQRRRASMVMWTMVIVALLLPWILPTLIVAFFGMIPALVALIVDRSHGKYGAISVAALNFAGLFPYLLKLWAKSQSLESAATIISDVFALLVIYGAAAAGWIIYMTIPSSVASVFQVLAQHRVVALREQQRKILEEWGESIARPETPAGKASNGT